MTEAKYKVQVGMFEGPIELLLGLIEDRKFSINDVSLSAVTDEYVSHIQKLEDFSFGDVTHFISIAATLILIKSKSLLPLLQLSSEEEESIDELKRRLELHKLFGDLGIRIGEEFGMKASYARSYVPREVVFAPDKRLKPQNLLQHLCDALELVPQKEFLPKASVKKVIHIEEMMESLTKRIQEGMQVSFREFAKNSAGGAVGKEQKIYTVVSFLAILELARNGIITLLQKENFADIEIGKKSEEEKNREDDGDE